MELANFRRKTESKVFGREVVETKIFLMNVLMITNLME
jgi:hypothetical protein